MKLPCAVTLCLSGAVIAGADTVDEAIVAAMQLAEVPNYSWTSNVVDDARTYDIQGKCGGGYTWQRQPMPHIIARRLGRDGGYNLEAIFSEPLRYVIQTPDGWKRLEELPKQHRDWADETEWLLVSMPVLRTPDMPADAWGMDPFGLPPAIYVPVLRAHQEDDEKRVYSNYQFALSPPHEELGIIVSSHIDLEVEGDTASGTLTDLGARLLLVHDGHEYIQPVLATGRFKLWLADHRVQKFTVELAGIVVVDRKTVYVRQKSVTQITDVGTTAFAVPPDAQRKL